MNLYSRLNEITFSNNWTKKYISYSMQTESKRTETGASMV